MIRKYSMRMYIKCLLLCYVTFN